MTPPTTSTNYTSNDNISTESASIPHSDNTGEQVVPIIELIKKFTKENQSSVVTSTTSKAKQAAALTTAHNPVSDWEEPVEMSFVTLFELYRQPRPIIQDGQKRIKLPLKTLHAEFCCPICLGYIKRTSIVMECLHRFCAECIEKCLRLGKKECPKCRVHIPSRRSLRPDPNFDKLIVKIYGDVKVLEKQEEKEIEIFNKARNMNNAYSESRRKGMLHQAIQRRKKTQTRSSLEKEIVDDVQPILPMPSLPPISVNFLEESPLVNFILRKDPSENLVRRLDKEFIRTNVQATVQILKSFLSEKLQWKEVDDIQIFVFSEDKIVVLDNHRTLGDVQEELWHPSDEDLVIHYRIRKGEKGQGSNKGARQPLSKIDEGDIPMQDAL